MTANIPLMSFFLFVDLTSARVEKVYLRHFSLPEDQKVKAQRLNVTLVFVMATLSQDRRHLRSATFGGDSLAYKSRGELIRVTKEVMAVRSKLAFLVAGVKETLEKGSAVT